MVMKRVRVLIADDDPDVRDSLSLFFQCRGHEALTARDGAEAWSLFQTAQPDVAVLDILMPGLSGIEICRKAKDTGRFDHVPIILLSAKTAENEILEGFRAGAWDYVTKPYLNAEIIARTESAIRRVHLHREKQKGMRLDEFLDGLNTISKEVRPAMTRLLGELHSLRMHYRPSDEYMRERLEIACQNAARIIVTLDRLKTIDASKLKEV